MIARLAVADEGGLRFLEPEKIDDRSLEMDVRYKLKSADLGLPLFAVVEESGGPRDLRAQIVCNHNGRMIRPSGKVEVEGRLLCQFCFGQDENFVTVEIDPRHYVHIQQQRLVRGRRRGEFKIKVVHISPGITQAHIASEQATDEVLKYVKAIQACTDRLNCCDMSRFHYANIPGTGKRIRTRL